MCNKFFVIVKILVSFGILFFLVRRIDVIELVSKLSDISIPYFVLSVIFAVLAVIVISGRWCFIIDKIIGFPLLFSSAMRATFAGLFVGQILPGTIGMDVVRGCVIWKDGIHKKSLIVSLVMDRLISLFAVICMMGVVLPFLIPVLPYNIHVFMWFIFVTILASPVLIYAIIKVEVIWKWLKEIVTKLGFGNLKLSKYILFYSLAISVVGHGLVILSGFFMSNALGIDTALWMWMVLMPVIILITAIPISINGWGIREGAMIYLWELYGVAEVDAFLTSICLGIVALLASLPGMWFLIKGKKSLLCIP